MLQRNANNLTVGPTWTDEDRQRIRDMWMNEGMSASQIAAEFPGKSRNAIIGIVHRMGLTGSRQRPRRTYVVPPRTQRKAPFVKKAPVKVQPVPPPVDAPADIGPLNLTLFDLTDATCKFPFGREVPFTFCGHATAPGLPYCKAHCLMAYQPPKARDRAPRPREKINF